MTPLVLFSENPYDGYPDDFLAFHQANPHVFATLRTLAFQAVNAGAERLGMKALYEVARWQLKLDTSTSTPKLNNVWTPYYARLLMQEVPALDGVFETRTIRREA